MILRCRSRTYIITNMLFVTPIVFASDIFSNTCIYKEGNYKILLGMSKLSEYVACYCFIIFESFLAYLLKFSISQWRPQFLFRIMRQPSPSTSCQVKGYIPVKYANRNLDQTRFTKHNNTTYILNVTINQFNCDRKALTIILFLFCGNILTLCRGFSLNQYIFQN